MNGTYTLNVTNAAGCWDIETTDVTVSADPVATASNDGPYNGCPTDDPDTDPDGDPVEPGEDFFIIIAQIAVLLDDFLGYLVETASTCCEGDTISLTGGPDGMDSYSWTGPNSYSSSSQSPTIPGATLAMSGTYTLNVTNAAGCWDTTTTDVIVNLGPPCKELTPKGNSIASSLATIIHFGTSFLAQFLTAFHD